MAKTTQIDRRRSELSPAQRALLEQRLRGLRGDAPSQGIPRRTAGTAPPLSFAQERLWFLDQLSPGDTTYNCIDTLPLDFAVDVPVLERSLNEIVRRHESLRTTFGEAGGVPVQVIAPSLHMPLPVIDLRHLPRSAREVEVHRLGTEEAERPFDLAVGPLVRTTLVRTGEARYVFLVAMHHIVGDGWSMGVFWNELTAIWEAFERGRPSPLPELPIQYADFAAWQRASVTGESLERDLAYWRQQLHGLPVLSLPTDHPRPPVQTFRGGRHPIRLSPGLTSALQELGRREGTTPFMTLLAVFAVLLHRYSEQEDFAVGTYLAGRNRVELENLIGFFINTLVMRCDLSGDPSFRRVLARVKDVAVGAYSHQDMPFALLVQELRPARDPSRNPLFQVLFHVFNAPNWDPRDFSADQWVHDLTPESAVFDLVLTLVETRDGFAGAFEYNVDLFDAPTIARMAGHFVTLAEQLVARPDAPVASVAMLGEPERRLLLHDWNDTRRDRVPREGLVESFERRVDAAPDAAAFVMDGRVLTYAQLDRAANRLATHLQASGVEPGALVAVLAARGFDAVVALVAVLKAGAVYVPLDLSYPRDRLGLMLEDARVAAVLASRASAPAVAGLAPRVICFDEPSLAAAPGERLGIRRDDDTPAYVIFTSGSTGRPKGIVVPHRQVINRLAWMEEAYPFGTGEVSCHKTALSFVDSLWELLGPLLQGTPSVIVPDGVLKDPAALVDLLAASGVTRIWLVPSLLSAMLDLVPDLQARLPALRFWVCTGETLPVELYRRARRLLPGSVLYNLYGTSEVWDATWFDPEADPIDEDSTSAIPIGRPIHNVQTYVLDRRRAPVPIGVPGELYVGGAGLALEYLGQPELTAERFVPNPFAAEAGALMYRTGDVARYRADGTLECLGRMDHQVKLRGFRIEPGEIESVLLQHEAVRHARVVVHEERPGEPGLVAYLVPWHARVRNEAGPTGPGWLDVIPEWREVWDETYKTPRADATPAFNISGFNSSYTGLPIPAEEVREWVDQAVARVLATAPRAVVEIGAGTGLLMSRIAPEVERYLATDFSPVAVSLLADQRARPGLSHVEIRERLADDLGDVPDESVDAVVINSVAQYFPSIDYLLRVLDGAWRIVRPGGCVFVGDVRSLPLLEAFHAAVELYRAGDGLPVGRLRERIQHRVSSDEELVVDPAFFFALRARHADLGDVAIAPKRGQHHNEFTCFRYDALLWKGPGAAVPPDALRLDWDEDRVTLKDLVRRLDAERPELVVLSRVPNRRVVRHAADLEHVAHAPASTPTRDVRHFLRNLPAPGGADPEALWGLAGEVPYTVDLYWPGPLADDRVDAWLRRIDDTPGAAPRGRVVPDRDVGRAKPWAEYANDPLHGSLTRRFVPDVSRFARERLPEHMVPGVFMVLDELPLNPNGKLDRLTLPAPDARSGASPFVSPRTRTEALLTAMFAEMLGTDHVGVHDDFFADLRGHSLLAIRLVSRIREAFRVELPLQAVFESPTVAGLSQVLSASGPADRLGAPSSIERVARERYARSPGPR